MEEFIDLRTYIRLLLGQWKLILGATVLAALTAFIVSLLMEPTYEATAVIVGTLPQDLVQFDSRFEAVQPDIQNQPLEAFQEIAKSDEMLQSVRDGLTFSLPEIQSLEEFRDMLNVEVGKDA
ncbi:MAG: Wzz/FepE/Etk N-terminal domain-containing protein, partial [Anaerolineae bacterium]